MGLEDQGAPAAVLPLAGDFCVQRKLPTGPLPATVLSHSPRPISPQWRAPGLLVMLCSFLEHPSLASASFASDLGSCNIPAVGLNNKLSPVPKDIIFFKGFIM